MRRYRLLGSIALLALAVAAMAQSAVLAQAPEDSLQVHVHLVNVPVTVLDREGRSVAGLGRQDFSLSEDGRPESIRVFEAHPAQPVSTVLAIDTSISVRPDLPLAKRAAHEFAHSMMRREDQMELLGFAGEVTQVVPFTSSLGALDHGLRSLHADGPTALYAAIVHAANDLEVYPGRKVIVVVSDGSNSVAGVDYQHARTAALRAQASIESIILVPIAANAGRDLGGEHALIQLSSDTGGQFFYADADNPLQDVMERLSLSLRSEYLLGYYPTQTVGAGSGSGGLRRIQLRMTNPALDRAYHLRYRSGYYADADR